MRLKEPQIDKINDEVKNEYRLTDEQMTKLRKPSFLYFMPKATWSYIFDLELRELGKDSKIMAYVIYLTACKPNEVLRLKKEDIRIEERQVNGKPIKILWFTLTNSKGQRRNSPFAMEGFEEERLANQFLQLIEDKQNAEFLVKRVTTKAFSKEFRRMNVPMIYRNYEYPITKEAVELSIALHPYLIRVLRIKEYAHRFLFRSSLSTYEQIRHIIDKDSESILGLIIKEGH